MDSTTTAAAPAPTTDTLSAAAPAAAVEKSPHDLLIESASTYTTEDGQTVKYLPTSLEPSQLGHEIDRIDLVVGELDKDISFHEENAKDAEGNFLAGDALTAKRDELIGAKKDELTAASDAVISGRVAVIDRDDLLNKRTAQLEQGQQHWNKEVRDQSADEFGKLQELKNDPDATRLNALKDELRFAEASRITAEEREVLQGKIAKEEALIARKMDPAQYEEAKLHRENAELKMAGLAYALDKSDNYKHLEESSERWEKKSAEFDKTISDGGKISRTTTDRKTGAETDNHDYLTSRYNSNPQEQAAKVKRVLSGSQVVGAVDTIIGDDPKSVMSNFESQDVVKDTKLPTREQVAGVASNTHDSYKYTYQAPTGWKTRGANGAPDVAQWGPRTDIVKYDPIDPREQYFGLKKDADGDLSYTNRRTKETTFSPVDIAKAQTPLPKSVREALSEREAALQATRDEAELARQFEASGRVNRTSESSEASQRSATTSVAPTNAETQGSQASSEERELDAQFKAAGRDKSGGPVSSSVGPGGAQESLAQEVSSRELAKYPAEPQLLASSQLEPSQPTPREQDYGEQKDEGALIAMLRALVTLLTLGMMRDQKYTSSRHNPEASLDSSRSVSQRQAGQQEVAVREEVQPQPQANMPRAQDEAREVLRRSQGQQEEVSAEVEPELAPEPEPEPELEGSDRESPAAEIAVPGQGEALPGLDSGLDVAVPEPVIDPKEAAMREAQEMAREIGRQMAFANEESLPEATNTSFPDAEHETERASKKDPAHTHVEKVEEDRRAQSLEDDDTPSKGESRA